MACFAYDPDNMAFSFLTGVDPLIDLRVAVVDAYRQRGTEALRKISHQNAYRAKHMPTHERWRSGVSAFLVQPFHTRHFPSLFALLYSVTHQYWHFAFSQKQT
jgi:hypothetical protein